MALPPLSPTAALGLVLLAGLFVAIFYVVVTDAHARGLSYPIALVLAVLAAILPMGILAYFVLSDHLGPRQTAQMRRERAAWTIVLASVVAFVLSATLSPPDPFTQLSEYPLFLLATLPFAYLVVFKNPLSRLKTAVR
ncbi:DUF7534 family protein [Halogranum rubrum]|nr:hypothetical protein [Halogranum salarium]